MQSVKSTEQGQKKGEMRMYENRTVEELWQKVGESYLPDAIRVQGVFGRFADRLIGSGSGGATAPLWGK